MLSKVRSPQGLRAVPTLLGGFGQNIETNLDPDRLAALLPYLSQLDLAFSTLPTQDIEGSFNLAADHLALSEVWSNPMLDGVRREAERQQTEEAREQAWPKPTGQRLAGKAKAILQPTT
ncbi:hypothetical protein [Deinococcus radiophilus]|uniref:hypothetical protein n=1 Tax=Deinococcus radiophilus TaxID=32062 RepID=UPI003606A805